MKIVIDTKEDLHNMKHILRLLHAISPGTGAKFDESMFNENQTPVPETPTGIFNMFDDSSSSTSTLETKKDDDNSDLSSLQVY